MKVHGQVENDMVLGTSAYKNGIRATLPVCTRIAHHVLALTAAFCHNDRLGAPASAL